MKEQRTQNGYYWVKPKSLHYKGMWVIATYEGKMFWVHRTGEAYTEDDLEIDEHEIKRGEPSELLQQRDELLKTMKSIYCTTDASDQTSMQHAIYRIGAAIKNTETIMEDEEGWQCPNCGEFWSIEEFDVQRCGSCGYPDYDEDDDELN